MRGPLVLLMLVAAVAAGTTSCGSEVPEPGASVSPAAPSVDGAIADSLAARAAAVRTRNQPVFMDGVDPADQRFGTLQARLFSNLQELPLAAFGYDLRRVTMLPDGRAQAEVKQIMQLRGYDAVPVETPGLFTYVKTGDGRWVLQADHDRAFDRDHGIDLQPWELTRIEAEEQDGVLGVFDVRSVDAAYQVMDAVSEGVADITPRIPVRWPGRVVVYALSNVKVMASLDNLPGGDPERLEGVAFSVPAEPGSPQLAGVRFMLHPRMIHEDDERRDRLIRHELTHVALGDRDDHVPTWLAEGIAEYISVQAVPADQRQISRDALEEAQAGLTALPEDASFNGERSAANYGVAWFACDYVAGRYGEDALWRLLEVMGEDGGTPEAGQDAVLERVLHIDSAELARMTGLRIVRTFT